MVIQAWISDFSILYELLTVEVLWLFLCVSVSGDVTILSCINTELVDTCWGLGQNINGVASRIHVVEEVDRQGRESKHQQPQHSKYIRHHYELHKIKEREPLKSNKVHITQEYAVI